MAVFVRAKRVTDPLDDQAKARLVGGLLSYVSSGSEHSGADADSPCLSELVHGFLEEDSEITQSPGYESDPDRVDSVNDRADAIQSVLKSTAKNNADVYKNLLSSHVLAAMEVFSCFRSQKSVFTRKVMNSLRELGHNAAICKTKWDQSGGLVAGNYEFIDVVQSSSSSTWQNRYIIELDFSSEFEIARPTNVYSRLLQSLPRVFIGKSEELKRIVKVMCEEAKRSLKSRQLSLPPWRKNRYMQNKWFGPYRRTVNLIPSGSLTPVINGVKCRVGFDDAVNGRLFVRTR